jgi:phage tail-like protein
MAHPAQETVLYPITAFNFGVEIKVAGGSSPLCNAAFSECDGLEMTMDVKTIREGGNNGQQIRLTGPNAYGTVTLKRGMTDSLDLWDWVAGLLAQGGEGVRAEVDVLVMSADGKSVRAHFVLHRCVPVKWKAPALNARDGMVAIEELQIAYEWLSVERPESGAGA